MRCQVASTVRSAAFRMLGEHLLDRIEVRTVGRQEEKPRADRANSPAHPWPLWLPRLSMMTMSPGLSVGTRN